MSEGIIGASPNIRAELGFHVGGGASPVNEPDYITNELQAVLLAGNNFVTIPHGPGPMWVGVGGRKEVYFAKYYMAVTSSARQTVYR